MFNEYWHNCVTRYTLYILYWVLQSNAVPIKKESLIQRLGGWGVGGLGEGTAHILHNKPISFFSVFLPPSPPCFSPLIQFSIGCLHHSHNANHSRSLFMRLLICKDCPSSSNSQQRGNITGSRVVLNLSLRTDLYFLIRYEKGTLGWHEFMDN